MFEIKNNHSPNYLVDFFKLLFLKGLRSTYFHFFRIPSNSTHTKSALSLCGPLLWNSLPSNLTISYLLLFRKALTIFCSNIRSKAFLSSEESALYK